MTPAEARRILALYRPGTPDATDPEVIAALEFARREPELQGWLEEHLHVEDCLRQALRTLPAPDGLRARVLASRVSPIVRLRRFLISPEGWAAAAAIAVLALAGVWWLGMRAVPDRFVDYRQRMVARVLRSYSMDIETGNLGQVREFMARAGSPSDFEIPNGLARLALTGGGRLEWRGNPVSMVCFDRGDKEMLFLFVMRREAVSDGPPPTPEVAQVNKLATVSWRRGENLYVLAGPPEAGFAERVR